MPVVEQDLDITVRKKSNAAALIVIQFWRNFSVKDVIHILLKACESVSTITICHRWKHITRRLAPEDTRELKLRFTETVAEAVRTANEAPGFGNVTDKKLIEVQAA